MHPHTQYRGFTPGWYAVPRWGTPINHRRPYPGLAGHSNESSTFSSRVSEAATFGIAPTGQRIPAQGNALGFISPITKNVGLDHHSTDRRSRSNCTRISGASFNSTRGLSSLRIWSQSRRSPWRTRTFSMSIQSLERPAKAFRTTRSSAWHTWREIPGKNSRNIALRHNDSSNGNPASATSMGMPSDVFRRSTRRSSANSAASGIRGANLERNA